jgi:hypothetical protein
MNDVADFYKPLDNYIDDFTLQQSEAAAQKGVTNHNIYEQRLGDPNFPEFAGLPRCIFFYYVRVNASGKLEVGHYFYHNGGKRCDPKTWSPIPHDKGTLEAIVQKLAKNGRRSIPKLRHPPVEGKNFSHIVWDRKSYVVIFMDEFNWKLHKSSNDQPGVVFITDKERDVAATQNHSFFDALDLDIEMRTFMSLKKDTRSAIAFINHMKGDDKGNDIGDGVSQLFRFKIFLDVMFEDDTAAMTVILDPDGNNLGPPVPPP